MQNYSPEVPEYAKIFHYNVDYKISYYLEIFKTKFLIIEKFRLVHLEFYHFSDYLNIITYIDVEETLIFPRNEKHYPTFFFITIMNNFADEFANVHFSETAKARIGVRI